MNKLSIKLVAAFALVILVGSAITYIVAQQRVNRQFQTYLKGRDQVHTATLAPIFADYYQQQGSWEGIQSALGDAMTAVTDGEVRRGRGSGAGREGYGGYGIGSWEGDILLLLDTANQVVFATQPDAIGQTMATPDPSVGAVIIVNGNPVGRLIVYSDSSGAIATLTDEFVTGLNRGVSAAAAVAGLVAIVMATVLVRHIVAPLHRLQAAANAITTGDLSQRVPALTSDELGDVGRSFNQMAVRLERDEIMRRNMMADIAHELRTPLTVMQGQVEALIDGVFPLATEQLMPIHDQIILLNRLVSDLRDVALADSGHLHLSISTVHMPALVRSVVAAIQPLAAEQALSVHVTDEPDLPPVLADAGRLRQVLHNLLNNTLRHTPAGGRVEISVRRQPARDRKGEHIAVSVEDTGAGISAQDLPHIFDRFYRSDISRRQGLGGTGLGLTIVRSIVEAHNGEIDVVSQAGQGTRITFTIPVQDPQDAND